MNTDDGKTNPAGKCSDPSGERFPRHPTAVRITEVGPRDGFQAQPRVLPTATKVSIIEDLIQSGLTSIQITSFVHPGKMPQMADAEDLVCQVGKRPGVELNALVLNRRGLDRALAAGMRSLELSMSASDTHSRRNTGLSHSRVLAEMKEMILIARDAGVHVRAGVQCAFGCAFEGPLSEASISGLAAEMLAAGAQTLALADTAGLASPVSVAHLLERILPVIGNTPLGLHFHDTRGLGLVNLKTALAFGVDRFDSSLGGMGGCPFIPGAAGNIATEDTLNLLASLDIETGVDMDAVAACTLRLEEAYQAVFPGRMHRVISNRAG